MKSWPLQLIRCLKAGHRDRAPLVTAAMEAQVTRALKPSLSQLSRHFSFNVLSNPTWSPISWWCCSRSRGCWCWCCCCCCCCSSWLPDIGFVFCCNQEVLVSVWWKIKRKCGGGIKLREKLMPTRSDLHYTKSPSEWRKKMDRIILALWWELQKKVGFSLIGTMWSHIYWHMHKKGLTSISLPSIIFWLSSSWWPMIIT